MEGFQESRAPKLVPRAPQPVDVSSPLLGRTDPMGSDAEADSTPRGCSGVGLTRVRRVHRVPSDPGHVFSHRTAGPSPLNHRVLHGTKRVEEGGGSRDPVARQGRKDL